MKERTDNLSSEVRAEKEVIREPSFASVFDGN